MSLTLGTGPLAGQSGGAFNFDLSGAPAHRIFFHDYPRRLRALVGDRLVLDTTGAKLLHETGILPVPYVPLDDFDHDLLERTDHTTHCPFKGDASYWRVRAGDTVVENAVWAYEDPMPAASWLDGYGALYWDKATAWFAEEERVFETGLPARAYIPRVDVVPAALGESESRSVCPYKGESRYLSVAGVEDAAWTYDAPLPDALAVQGHICFDPERVDVELGEPRAQLPA